MRLSLRTRRRIIKALTWPVALLVVGWLLSELGYRLAGLDGVSAQIYGTLSGLGDIVRFIGGVWLVIALIALVIRLDKTRRTN